MVSLGFGLTLGGNPVEVSYMPIVSESVLDQHAKLDMH